VDLNADVGEGVAPRADPALLAVVTSASVACGGHTGTRETMAAAVEAAATRSVVVGAHPSYPDPEGFGRRPVTMDGRALTASLTHQVTSLVEVGAQAGVRIRYVKPHGALYHDMASDEELCAIVVEATQAVDPALALLVQAGTSAPGSVRAAGGQPFAEGFADRRYRADGRLEPRDRLGAVISEPEIVVAQAIDLALRGGVRTSDGSWLPLDVSSICLHGDTPGAETLAATVAKALEDAGVELAPFLGSDTG
jgi:UPF0271 protein